MQERHLNEEGAAGQLKPSLGDALIGDPTRTHTETAQQRPSRSVIFVTTSVFMGYAALVVLQHRLKKVHDDACGPGGCGDDAEFKHDSTLNYVGNLILRLAHNFVFACVSPHTRVHIALCSMALAMGVLAFAMCILKSTWIGWVFIAYFLGGVAIGTFESNLLTCITPLGHATKKWAILGMPLGFNLISVGGFLLLLVTAPPQRRPLSPRPDPPSVHVGGRSPQGPLPHRLRLLLVVDFSLPVPHSVRRPQMVNPGSSGHPLRFHRLLHCVPTGLTLCCRHTEKADSEVYVKEVEPGYSSSGISPVIFPPPSNTPEHTLHS